MKPNKPKVLTQNQWQLLKLLAQAKSLASRFYLTGGTALTAFYLPYRYSEDLDFFSEQEVDTKAINVFLRSFKSKLHYQSLEFNTSYNRNLFFLHFPTSVLKIEFTYFPFPQIEKPKVCLGIKVDSLTDIAVNKLFTIYQKPRSRDFIDLYLIQKETGISLEELTAKARVKFDWQIDKLKLGTQLLLAKELKDYPKLLINLKQGIWQDFFVKEAKKLGEKILR